MAPQDWKWIADRLTGPLELTPATTVDARAALEAWLAAQLAPMLDHQFERLAQLMYRLDVPETRFHEAMAAPDTPGRAKALARLMVDRELVRLDMRRRFSS